MGSDFLEPNPRVPIILEVPMTPNSFCKFYFFCFFIYIGLLPCTRHVSWQIAPGPKKVKKFNDSRLNLSAVGEKSKQLNK
jgi:hypothetical protein